MNTFKCSLNIVKSGEQNHERFLKRLDNGETLDRKLGSRLQCDMGSNSLFILQYHTGVKCKVILKHIHFTSIAKHVLAIYTFIT